MLVEGYSHILYIPRDTRTHVYAHTHAEKCQKLTHTHKGDTHMHKHTRIQSHTKSETYIRTHTHMQAQAFTNTPLHTQNTLNIQSDTLTYAHVGMCVDDCWLRQPWSTHTHTHSHGTTHIHSSLCKSPVVVLVYICQLLAESLFLMVAVRPNQKWYVFGSRNGVLCILAVQTDGLQFINNFKPSIAFMDPYGNTFDRHFCLSVMKKSQT